MGDATLYRCRTPTDWLCLCGRTARELRRRGVEVICDSRRIVEHVRWRDAQLAGR